MTGATARTLRLDPLDWLVLLAAVACFVVIVRDAAAARRAAGDPADTAAE